MYVDGWLVSLFVGGVFFGGFLKYIFSKGF